MDAGVPIKRPGRRHLDRPGHGRATSSRSCTDIQGDEDHYGDMDFKVAGTQKGITGIQLDIKLDGITEEIVRGALEQAREARLRDPQDDARDAAGAAQGDQRRTPRGCCTVKINPEKIGLLIGPGGKNIRAHPGRDRREDRRRGRRHGVDRRTRTRPAPRRPSATVEALCAESQGRRGLRGQGDRRSRSSGRSSRSRPGRDGLCHISELDDGYVGRVDDVVKVGDKVQVKVIAIDDQDRVKLSRKALLPPREGGGEGGGGGDRRHARTAATAGSRRPGRPRR